jgi:hypothetical protein
MDENLSLVHVCCPLPLETWVSVGTVISVAIALLIAMRSGFAELRSEFSEFGSEVKADIRDLRTELKADIAAFDGRVTELDRRVYALAVGLRPYVEEAPQSRPSGHAG